ncbi:MBL fold metallo-hydrolase [Candidatus Bathyarchaeota archaeon]|nr:MBL fold metallo-hydrolase [Candidatus Bathyarchaeota archaeon]
MFEKVTSSIYLVGSGNLSGQGDCMVYGIGVNDGICLVDAGTRYAGKIMENITQTPLVKGDGGEGEAIITHLILTHAHYDHAGAANQFKKLFPSMEIIAHQDDLPAIQGAPGTEKITAESWYGAKYIPVTVDIVLSKNSTMLHAGSKKITALHTPGHTPGSISLLVDDDEKKVLFGQDIHGPFMDEFNSSIKDWGDSMKMLLELDADILCEGHFGIYRGRDAVKDFISSHLRKHGF